MATIIDHYFTYFKVKVEGVDAYVDLSYTPSTGVRSDHARALNASTGIDFSCSGDKGYMKDIFEQIIIGYQDLMHNSYRYRIYDTLDNDHVVRDSIKFLEEIIRSWEYLKKNEPELSEVTKLWME